MQGKPALWSLFAGHPDSAICRVLSLAARCLSRHSVRTRAASLWPARIMATCRLRIFLSETMRTRSMADILAAYSIPRHQEKPGGRTIRLPIILSGYRSTGAGFSRAKWKLPVRRSLRNIEMPCLSSSSKGAFCLHHCLRSFACCIADRAAQVDMSLPSIVSACLALVACARPAMSRMGRVAACRYAHAKLAREAARNRRGMGLPGSGRHLRFSWLFHPLEPPGEDGMDVLVG